MLATLRKALGSLRRSLTHVGERQPLHKAAFVVILALDLFVLVSIFDGLDAHTRQLASPWDRVPPLCRELVVEASWTPANRLDRLGEQVAGRRADVVDVLPARKGDLHPTCARLVALVDAVAAREDLARALETRRKTQAQLRDVGEQLSSLKAAYDTALLETIARRDGTRPELTAIRSGVADRTVALEEARAQLASIDARLGETEAVTAVWKALEALSADDRAALTSDLRRMTFWFPVKRLGMQLLFALPLVAVFLAWSAASRRRGRGLQTLVASHLLVVASIPVFFLVTEAVYEVIPKRLLARVLDLLVSLKLVALWHYAVMALAVASALLLAVFIQRKLFSREKLLERRIARGLCQDCGRRTPASVRHCPFCGVPQYRACARCGGDTPVHARFCTGCGREPAAAG